MTFFLLIGLVCIALSCVLVLRAGALGRARQRETLAQIGSYGFRSPAAAEAAPPRDLRAMLHAIAAAAGTRVLARLGPERERGLRAELDAAGLYRTSVATFLGFRALAVLVPMLGIPLVAGLDGSIGTRALLVAGWMTGFGWIAPTFFVRRRGRQRVEQIDREVPELVDLLVTSVEAGVAFGAGIQLAAKSIRGPLGDELRLVLREQSLGLTPAQALRNLATRVETPTLRAFTQALIQGEALGVSIGRVLRELAVDMRKRRRQAAEERAQKTPTKILFPLIVLILPAMFILALGPMFYRVMGFFMGS